MTLPPSIASARELVRTLVRLGVHDVVLAPGSRSAPLAYALAAAADPGQASPVVRLHVRIDERDAAFLALGLARGGQVRAARDAHVADGASLLLAAPVAVVTTSGTAVANLLPAVLEAHHSGVPLLLLTADRPHELRGTGANQTTDQVAIFGPATRLTVDVPAPTGRTDELRDLRAVLVRAVAAATGARTQHPGPVHLNLAYREPLTPDLAQIADLRDISDLAPAALDGRTPHLHAWPPGTATVRAAVPPGEGPHTQAPHDHDPSAMVLDPGALAATVVVAGDGAGPAARALAEARDWPLLAEASSGSAAGTHLVRAHRLVLGSPALTAEIRQVVLLGRPTLSRPVQQLLARPDVRVVVIATGSGPWPDAARNASAVLDHVPRAWLTAAPDPLSTEVLARWQAASEAAGRVVAQALQAGEGTLTALAVADAVASASAPDDTLVIGSSNPVRDLDLVARWAEPPTVLANRGLAGIDGTVSTATGIALGLQHGLEQTGRPGAVRALLGDLTFLHDVGGLLRGPGEPPVSLQIVVVNDDGGSIFATLEHGRTGDRAVFERVFATPHGANLGALCAGYGVHHELVRDVDRLRTALAEVPHGVSVLEVQVERASRHHSSQDLAAAVVEAL